VSLLAFVNTMSATIRCFIGSYLAVIAFSVRAFAEHERGETIDQSRCGTTRGRACLCDLTAKARVRQDEVEASVRREPAYGAPLHQKLPCQ
jgi:hypothetical protein